jgi:cell wall-associated NlpC family hydrolase
MTRRFFRAFSAFVLITGLIALAPPVGAQSLDAKRAEAAALEARIRQQGSRLSIAAEDFNAARLERERLQAKAQGARTLVQSAEQRWGALRDQLGKRARVLYMHPGAALNAFFGAQTLGEVARARVYGGEVLLTDSALVLEAERARHEVMEQARTLENLRAEARRKENDIASRRAQVQQELSAQRSLLGNVRGDIAKVIAAERARAAAAAARQAASPAASTPARPPAVGTAEHAVQADEPTSAPPAVRASAGKAVATARAQIGKPYEWGASGPGSYDCSGLTSYAWGSAGVSLPHSSRAQYSSLPHVARSQLQPGDLVFFGSPIHHVGIYEGGGMMINAPETGEHVRRDSIGRSDYAGAARP